MAVAGLISPHCQDELSHAFVHGKRARGTKEGINTHMVAQNVRVCRN